MRVMVIVSDQRYSSTDTAFPPVGTKGTVISGLDEDGEYEVLFDHWPAVSPVDPGWFVHKSMIVFLGGDAQSETENFEAALHA